MCVGVAWRHDGPGRRGRRWWAMVAGQAWWGGAGRQHVSHASRVAWLARAPVAHLASTSHPSIPLPRALAARGGQLGLRRRSRLLIQLDSMVTRVKKMGCWIGDSPWSTGRRGCAGLVDSSSSVDLSAAPSTRLRPGWWLEPDFITVHVTPAAARHRRRGSRP